MALQSRRPTEERKSLLEDELHEGDGRIPGWLWLVVAGAAALAVLVAPFQLFWPVWG